MDTRKFNDVSSHRRNSQIISGGVSVQILKQKAKNLRMIAFENSYLYKPCQCRSTDYWADDDLGDWLSTNRGINRVQHLTWFPACWMWSGFGRSRSSSPDSFCIPMVPNLWLYYFQNLVFFLSVICEHIFHMFHMLLINSYMYIFVYTQVLIIAVLVASSIFWDSHR